MEDTVAVVEKKFAIAGRKLDQSAIRKADSYQQLTPTEQIRQKPTMWISDINPRQAEVYRFNGNKIVSGEIPDYIEGVERLFIEILSNAVDNCTYSIHYGRKPDDIHVRITNKEIVITNGGCHIPLTQLPDGKWIPDILFGELFSSSHYDQVKTKYKQDMGSGGTYGVGATLVNVFSELFEVIVEDPIQHKRYIRSWCKNIPNADPDITFDKNITETKVSVRYILDFPFFSLEEYSINLMQLFAFHAITAGFTAKVPIHLTLDEAPEEIFDVRLIKKYAALFEELTDVEGQEQALEHYTYSNAKYSYQELLDKHVEIPKVEMLLFDLPNPPVFQLTFVNGMITPQNGVHLDEACKALFGEIIEDPRWPEGKQLASKLTAIKKHVSIILSVRVPDPKFKGQCKSCLNSPKPDFSNIPDTILKKVKVWETFTVLKSIVNAVTKKKLQETDGKKERRIYDMENLVDANDAGTAKSKDCSLFIVEGLSASSYVKFLRDLLPGGRDKHGIFKLNGKPINAMRAEDAQLVINKVYGDFKKALGLQEFTDYSSTEKFRKLRYGHVIIATDADTDGWHIMGLILCIFFTRFKSLLDRRYVSFWRTPILRLIGKKERLSFYTKAQFLKWKEGKNMNSWDPVYCKGLGTASKEHVHDDFRDGKNMIRFINDEDTPHSFILAFDETKSDARKEWMKSLPADFLETSTVPPSAVSEPQQSISHFVHTALKMYSLENLQRSIPNVMDGLKDSMRKALAAGIQEFGLAGGLKSKLARLKIFELVGMTTKEYAYHHGDAILGKVISYMARQQLGTNNVPWFQQFSSMGTIDDNEKPQARYAFLSPAWWWSLVYNEKDMELLDYVYEEDKKVEPKFYLPVVAWSLCNDMGGIATGYSTSLRGYNIEEVAVAHLYLLEGKPIPYLKPWWRGFTGNVSVIPSSEARKWMKDHNSDDVELDPDCPAHGEVCVVEGTYTIVGNKIIVTSLPIRTIEYFKKVLKGLIDEGLVSEFRDHSDTYKELIRIEVDLASDPETGSLPKFDIVKKFRLRRLLSLTNMVMLDINGLPRKFKNVNEILLYFHEIRLKYYELRRQSIVRDLDKIADKLVKKIKLIETILQGKIKYVNVKKQDIVDQLSTLLPGVPIELFHGLKLSQLSEDDVRELYDEKEKNDADLKYYREVSKEKLWSDDIREFLKQYRSRFGSHMSFRE